MASLDVDDPCFIQESAIYLDPVCGDIYAPTLEPSSCVICWRNNACDPNQVFTCADLEYCVDICDRSWKLECHAAYYELAKCEANRCGLSCQTKDERVNDAYEECEPNFGKRNSCAECVVAGDGGESGLGNVHMCLVNNMVGPYNCDVVSQCLIDRDCLNCDSE